MDAEGEETHGKTGTLSISFSMEHNSDALVAMREV